MARYPGAIWYPTSKSGYGNDNQHLKRGCAVHSAEGYAAGMLAIINNASAQKSWTFSIMKSGAKYQHVDTENIQWTNGGYQANKNYWGIECEGVAGESLTPAQLASLVEVLKWLWATHGLGAPTRRVNLWEHGELTQVYGTPWTACPSGRIPWTTVIQQMGSGGGSGGDNFLSALTPEEQREILQHTRNLDTENDQELAGINRLIAIFDAVVANKWGGGQMHRWQKLEQVADLLMDAVPDGRGGQKPRMQLLVDGATASIPMLVRSPTTGYIYEVLEGKVIHGSNPTVAAATWGPNWSNYLQVLDKNNPEHAEIFRMEAQYPDGVPAELGGF